MKKIIFIDYNVNLSNECYKLHYTLDMKTFDIQEFCQSFLLIMNGNF